MEGYGAIFSLIHIVDNEELDNIEELRASIKRGETLPFHLPQ